MIRSDWTLKGILLVIAVFLGIIAVRPLIVPEVTAMAQPARFDHVYIAASTFLYKGQQGMLVLDRRNANVWFIPKVNDQFQTPVWVIRLPFEKLDQAPQ
jgi:hypothetical protein